MGKRNDFSWKIGGQQGEGIESAGEIFALALHRAGYYVFTYRHFMSLIKGGHTHFKVRITPTMKRHHGDDTDVLLAFDQRTIDENIATMTPGGLIIADEHFHAVVPEDADVTLISVPMTEMARDAGNVIMKNMVALGVSAALVGLEPESFRPLLQERLGGKGDELVNANMELLKASHKLYLERDGETFTLPPAVNAGKKRLLMTGNEALGLGSLAGGCRLVFQYPITPATDIMYWMLANLPKVGGAVLQAEDELAAINMAIGANFAGARAMTNTSGPGFSLMQEAIGLAATSETPVVLTNVQRAGPSTGLPTKTEQSDLNIMLFGSHGEIPRIVLAPATIEECYEYAIKAFNLADFYQTPVILTSDLYMGMNRHGIDVLRYEPNAIDRGKLLSDEDVAAMKEPYYRYALTEDGISPRTIPGQPGGMHVSMGNEHTSFDHEETEDPEERRRQMEKRLRKLAGLEQVDWATTYHGDEEPDLLLIGFGSTFGAIEEAADELRQDGVTIGHLHIRLLHPFPVEQVRAAVLAAKQALVVEINATGQLRRVLEQEIGHHDRYASCLKYDGNPFTVDEIVAQAREQLASLQTAGRS